MEYAEERLAVSTITLGRSQDWVHHVISLLDAAMQQLCAKEKTAHGTLLEAASLLRQQIDHPAPQEAPDGRERLLAFRHAEAKQIEVDLRYDERQLRLRIRDDGKGIDPKFLTGEGRAGHFGLLGMRERAKLVRGKLTVWSAPDSGTEIELSVPAAHAYAASPGRSWIAEQFSGTGSEKGA
jgi:signal transduction histidine kinase